jgi:glutaminyl-peptide cyclotransferase
VAAATVLAACGDDSSATAAKVNRFNATRAFKDLEYQVKLGPRPSKSPTAIKLAEWARTRLPRGRTESVPGGLRNVIGTVPGKKPAILIGAHYDTKTEPPGFLGAEDSAGGTAAVLELARYFSRAERPAGAPELRFVLFDGEECDGDDHDFYNCGLRGSRAYAKRHAKELRAAVVLDFIAQKDLRLTRDDSSDLELWSRLRRAAKRVGVGSVFPDETQGTILDDHTPFLRAGVPSIDLIDFDFPCWHKPCDDLTAVSRSSLDKSGEAVLELLRTWK